MTFLKTFKGSKNSQFSSFLKEIIKFNKFLTFLIFYDKILIFLRIIHIFNNYNK